MSVTDTRPDVSRESSAPETSGGTVAERLARLEAKVDELLTDSRAARPLLERYLSMTGGRVGAWAGVGGGKRRR